MSHNLTQSQQDLLRGFVVASRKNEIPEEFRVLFGEEGTVLSFVNSDGFVPWPDATEAKIVALDKEGFLRIVNSGDYSISVSLTKKSYEAVDSDFHLEDTETNTERTLISWWRMANFEERAGMVGVYTFVFLLGYLCEKARFFSRFIDLIIEVIP